ncbi:hypothetical protein RB2328 [Rhodopirellula baltica SH 1]|uniref:Uncharacterized protein n=1 Tax=Rhodopirellula baltica (strain DSM 10527 / NCIMB 13988 / SH1) TaxID=243090 RepID=Q7UW15_RHOBA|nr:hypothetical protein RB2328 [Rhodopirellula baltica SH 1]
MSPVTLSGMHSRSAHFHHPNSQLCDRAMPDSHDNTDASPHEQPHPKKLKQIKSCWSFRLRALQSEFQLCWLATRPTNPRRCDRWNHRWRNGRRHWPSRWKGSSRKRRHEIVQT